MRRWLIILFVLLLPWRLWAGDAMALEVLHSAPAGAHGPAQMVFADPTALSGHIDFALHETSLAASHAAQHGAAPQVALADDPACPGQAAEAGAHGLCLLCGICHQALAVPLRLGAMQTALPARTPLPARSVIVQAEREPELKPPIF